MPCSLTDRCAALAVTTRCYAASIFPRAGIHAGGQRASIAVIGRPAKCPSKEALMVPLLLWILGVPGLIIILLLLLGIVKI
jgi:hypothetical protein